MALRYGFDFILPDAVCNLFLPSVVFEMLSVMLFIE